MFLYQKTRNNPSVHQQQNGQNNTDDSRNNVKGKARPTQVRSRQPRLDEVQALAERACGVRGQDSGVSISERQSWPRRASEAAGGALWSALAPAGGDGSWTGFTVGKFTKLYVNGLYTQ